MRSRPPPPAARPFVRRVLAVASVGYVGSLAVWADAGKVPLAWAAAAASLVVVALTSGARSGPVRAAGWGTAVATAALAGGSADRVLYACSAIGAFVTTASACVAVARMAVDGGLARGPRPSPVLPAIASGVGWWWAIGERFVAPAGGWEGGALRGVVALSSGVAVGVAALALVAHVVRTRQVRRLELGVAERVEAMRASFVALVLATAIVAVVAPGGGDAVVRFGLVAGAALVCAIASHPDAVRVASAVRRAIALSLVGGSVALVGTLASEGSGASWITTLLTSLAVLVVAARASALEAPLRPCEGVWLDAFERARDEALRADPEEAIRATLMALRAPAGLDAPSPELWSLNPTRVCTVDAAGYLHEAEAELPETLLLHAAGEPEATLRSELLAQLEVRRADLRP
ncbi:MAG: hypothetical protein ACRENE_26175, partial [Polyangiaceae bacterium]